MDGDERLSAAQFRQLGGVDDWRVLVSGASAWFGASSHAAGAALVRRVADLVGNVGRLPDVDVRAGGVRVRVGAYGLTEAEVAVARAVSAAARDLGLAADPTAVQAVRLGIDALEKSSVMSFWRAMLGYERAGEDDLVDAMRRDPAIRFQQQDRPRPLRNRIHVDVARPSALIPGRAAVEAVGGRFFGGEYDVRFADAEGNEADVIPVAPSAELGEESDTADWRDAFSAMTFYPIASPSRAAELAAVVAGLADEAGLPLPVDVRADGVTIDSGKDQWENERFPELARRVQAAARGMRLTADTTRLRFIQLGIDAVDIPVVREFWRAVLGYENDPRSAFGVTDIYDPRRLNPPIFFQQMSASEQARREQRNRIHVDVFVPEDQARARIDAGLAAGGRIVYDDEAPKWWTLADPEGNEVDIAIGARRP